MADDPKIITIDLVADLVDGAANQIRQTFRIAQPARVDSPVRATSRADVVFPVRWMATNIEVREDPPAPALPVLMPRGGGYGVYFDLRQGDLGLAIACDGPPSGLYDTGDPVTPQFAQGHDYGCAVFYPGGRVSSTETPTDPPNPAGTFLVGADDGSAAITFKGAGIPDTAEQGTVIVAAATHLPPAFSVLLGGDAAVLGVARDTDSVAPNLGALSMTTWISAVSAAINTLAPGTISPPLLAAVLLQIGTISSASTKVASE